MQSVNNIVQESSFLSNPEGHRPHCHSASIAKTSHGLICVWYAYPEEECQDAILAVSVRNKGSRTWSKAKHILQQNKSSLANPVVFEDPNGRIWIQFVSLAGRYWDSAILNSTYSEDGGQTWSASSRICQDKGMMVRHAPIVVNGNELLLPAYDENKVNETVLMRSLSPYEKWEEVFRFKGHELIQPSLVRTGEKTLSLFFRPTDDPRVIWRSASSDDGRTWSQPIKMMLPCPLSGIAAAADGENVFMIYNPDDKKRSPLAIAASQNQGVSWTEPYVFETANLEVSYPAFLYDEEDGLLHGVYTFNRRLIKYVSISPKEYLSYAG